jgi:hypothetical protein
MGFRDKSKASASLFKDQIFSRSEHAVDSFSLLPHATLEASNSLTKYFSYFSIGYFYRRCKGTLA